MGKGKESKSITLRDIARETGYSINTISHALRFKDDISQETGEKIRQIAHEMGYTGNQLASSLRSGRTNLLAVILGGMSNPFYGIMADTIQDAAQAAGYSLIILCARDNSELELKLVEQAISRQVDGIILFPTAGSKATIQRLRDSGTPFVLMSRYLTEGEADSVVCDEVGGAYLATRHLIERGCRKLAYISSTTVVFSSEQRIKGFTRACDDSGITPENRSIIISSDSILNSHPAPDWQEKLAADLCKLKASGFDGLFVFCDVEAWHALEVLQNTADLQPNDFSIVSFDDLGTTLSYPMTVCSVGGNYVEMAEKCMELLEARIHHDTSAPRTVLCPVHLQCRGSCKRL
ncbi:MAG: LacI family DNA-binding transcriptional regulator [Clostridia bacterium]|nr:LacI family DNA-binding transcriptional regulator [Clostridia bacterium]